MKILLVANTDWYLFNFRMGLARALAELGREVVVVCPPGPYVARLQAAGFRWVELPLARRSLSPLSALRTVQALRGIYRRERPTLVHHFTLKCVVYGSIAARIEGVRAVINAITGLGCAFASRSLKSRLLVGSVLLLMRVALRDTQIITQNPDDSRLLLLSKAVREPRLWLIRGSGVDTQRLVPNPAPVHQAGLRVLMACRLLWSKGIGEYVEAAAMLRARFPGLRFVVAGGPDADNPDSISAQTLAAWARAGGVEFIGHHERIDELLRNADIVVLPSYREGVPRILLEAAAMGLPLIATDVPGCREIVRHGDTGLLVPVRDSAALAAAIGRLAESADLRQAFGARARSVAVAEFDQDRVISRTLAVYGAAMANAA